MSIKPISPVMLTYSVHAISMSVDLKDMLLDLADSYEMLGQSADSDRRDSLRCTTSGSRLPPGAGAILDADERSRLRGAIETFASRWMFWLWDQQIVDRMPPDASGKLRLIAVNCEEKHSAAVYAVRL